MLTIDVQNFEDKLYELERCKYELDARERLFKYIADGNFEFFNERYNIYVEDYSLCLLKYRQKLKECAEICLEGKYKIPDLSFYNFDLENRLLHIKLKGENENAV